MCHEVALCAAAALSNATLLAAEVLALGGQPPNTPVAASGRVPVAQSIEEHVRQARSALAHYQSRLAMARRLGLLRLQEVFRDIVLSKRTHLAHATVLASAAASPTRRKSNRERPHAHPDPPR